MCRHPGPLKFKVRCSKYRYTYVVHDKAKVLRSSIREGERGRESLQGTSCRREHDEGGGRGGVGQAEKLRLSLPPGLAVKEIIGGRVKAVNMPFG